MILGSIRVHQLVSIGGSTGPGYSLKGFDLSSIIVFMPDGALFLLTLIFYQYGDYLNLFEKIDRKKELSLVWDECFILILYLYGA